MFSCKSSELPISSPPEDWSNPDHLREMILNTESRPLVFSNFITDWPAMKWNLPYLASVLQNQITSCRLGLKHVQGVQWETECDYEDVTVGQFSEWVSGRTQPDNPLMRYDRDKHWGYIDYKYMKDMLSTKPHMLECISWERFGFVGRSGRDSTMWLGSEQAFTVGHYDTYGCNLVAQISGRKRWILFPPEQTDDLYPTRVPFEESSVFSEVNIAKPDLLKFPRLKRTTPYIVILEAGDVLLVPRHWWHFVECLEPAVSINTWIALDADHEARVQEALTRTLVCALMVCEPGDKSEGLDFLNPNQEFFSLEENKEAVIGALRELTKLKNEQGNVSNLGSDDCRSDSPADKMDTWVKVEKRKLDAKLPTEGKRLKLHTIESCKGRSKKRVPEQISIKAIEPSTFQDYLTFMKTAQTVVEMSVSPKSNHSSPEVLAQSCNPETPVEKGCGPGESAGGTQTSSGISSRALLKCFTHPRVIALVSDLLKNDVKQLNV